MQHPPPPVVAPIPVDERPESVDSPSVSVFGLSLTTVRDLDGDGARDVAIGHCEGDEQYVWLVSGRTGEPLRRWSGAREDFGAALAGIDDSRPGEVGRLAVASVGRVELRSIDSGAELWNRALRFGGRPSHSPSLCALHDVDGDGIDEIVAGIPSVQGSETFGGRVLVLSGADGHTLLELEGETDGDGFGACVADVGDVDGDGVNDLAARGLQCASGGPHVRVHSGRTGAMVRRFRALELSEDVYLRSFGSSIAGLGDVDGDGLTDLAIGAPEHDEGRSTVFVLSGANGSVLREVTLESSGLGCALAPSRSAADPPELVVGADAALSVGEGEVRTYALATGSLRHRVELDGPPHFGALLANAGDVDGDGHDDCAAGCDVTMNWEPGAVAMISGARGEILWIATAETLLEGWSR